MIKDDKKMIKEYFNQYEYGTDYEFDVKSVESLQKTCRTQHYRV